MEHKELLEAILGYVRRKEDTLMLITLITTIKIKLNSYVTYYMLILNLKSSMRL